MQGSGAAYYFNPVEDFCGRGVIAFGIAEGVGADIIAILAGVEIAYAVGVEAAAADGELDAGAAVVLPDIEAGYFGVDLPGVVGGGVGGDVLEDDDFALLSGVDAGAVDVLEPGDAEAARRVAWTFTESRVLVGGCAERWVCAAAWRDRLIAIILRAAVFIGTDPFFW